MTVASVVSILKGEHPYETQVIAEGWVRTRRDSKAGISFLNVYDGSCFDCIQGVVPSELDNYQSEVLKVTAGCAVRMHGAVVASQGKGQAFELKVTKIEVVGWVEDPDAYPMAAKRHSVEHLRELAHLRPRTNLVGAVMRVRNCLSQAIHRFFHEQGYLWTSTPIVTASDCEGAGEMFRVSTLDLNNLPRTETSEVDYSKDFLEKKRF